MLDFCGEKGIVCDVEEIPIDYANTAMERLVKKMTSTTASPSTFKAALLLRNRHLLNCKERTSASAIQTLHLQSRPPD